MPPHAAVKAVEQRGEHHKDAEHAGHRHRRAAREYADEQADEAGCCQVEDRAEEPAEYARIGERHVREVAAGQDALAGEEGREADHRRREQRDQDDQGRLGGEDEAALRRRRERRADQAVAVLVRHHERAEHAEEQHADHQDVEVGVERVEPGLVRGIECVPPMREAPAEKVRIADADDRGERRCHQHGPQRTQLDPFRGERGPRPQARGRGRAAPGTRDRGLHGLRHQASLLRTSRNAAAAAAATYAASTAKPCHGPSVYAPPCSSLKISSPPLSGRNSASCAPILPPSSPTATGNTSRIPNSAARAPGVRRSSTPMKRPSRPTAVRYRPPPNTAVSTPGSPIATCFAGLDSRAWPMKNAANESSVHQAQTTAANITAFMAITCARCGVAMNVPRIRPLVYSPVTVMTPSAPTNSWAPSIPRRLMKTGSNEAWSAGVMVAQPWP